MLEVKIFTLYPDLYPGPLDIGIFKKSEGKENLGPKDYKHKKLL